MQDRIKKIKEEVAKYKEFRELLNQNESREELLKKLNDYLIELQEELIKIQEEQIKKHESNN